MALRRGRPVRYPQDITQTADGYIWVSTSNGLFRFDGMHFRRWIPPPGEVMPSSSTWRLLGARDGSLYVGTDRGLARITEGHLKTYEGSPRWPGPFVQDRLGTVWMGVGGSHSDPSAVCRVDDHSLSCLGAADGFACTRGLANIFDARGYLLIGSPEGICRWRPGAPAAVADLIYDGDPSEVSGTADGTVWRGCRRGRRAVCSV